MRSSVTTQALDAALALQLTVAWAGEGRCEPQRLGWWDTDLCDEAGGGDFLKRLLPQTHAWAALEAVREAARRVDLKARNRFEQPDQLRTLFFLGFELDEQLCERLFVLKRDGRPPSLALPLPVSFEAEFSRDELGAAWQGTPAEFSVGPGGRRLSGSMPAAPEALLARLASALWPFPEHYPLPHYLVSAGAGA